MVWDALVCSMCVLVLIIFQRFIPLTLQQCVNAKDFYIFYLEYKVIFNIVQHPWIKLVGDLFVPSPVSLLLSRHVTERPQTPSSWIFTILQNLKSSPPTPPLTDKQTSPSPCQLIIILSFLPQTNKTRVNLLLKKTNLWESARNKNKYNECICFFPP